MNHLDFPVQLCHIYREGNAVVDVLANAVSKFLIKVCIRYSQKTVLMLISVECVGQVRMDVPIHPQHKNLCIGLLKIYTIY